MQAAVVMHLPIPSNNYCRPSFLTSSSSTIILPEQVRPLQRRRYSSSKRSSMTVRAELQTTNPTSSATVTSSSSSIATHRVTVHDRQRGIVHEFVVPEVVGISLTPSSKHLLELLQRPSASFSPCQLAVTLLHLMQDQYILHTAESQDISLPFACRHGMPSYGLRFPQI